MTTITGFPPENNGGEYNKDSEIKSNQNGDSVNNLFDNNKEYDDIIKEQSAQILAGCDADGDGVVSVDEFADGFYNMFADDIAEYYAQTGESENIPDEQLQKGIKDASKLMAQIVGMSDIFSNGDVNSISKEEMSNLLKYLDKDGTGQITKEDVISFYDYCSDGGARDLEYGKKFRTGQELTPLELGLMHQFIVKPPFNALIDQAEKSE